MHLHRSHRKRLLSHSRHLQHHHRHHHAKSAAFCHADYIHLKDSITCSSLPHPCLFRDSVSPLGSHTQPRSLSASPEERMRSHRLSTRSNASSLAASSSLSSSLPSSSSSLTHTRSRPYRIRRILSCPRTVRRGGSTRASSLSLNASDSTAGVKKSLSTAIASTTVTSPSPSLSPLSSLPAFDSDLMADSSPSPGTSPQHDHLMMLKREAFQELASQTQRFDDIFVAKMIYWESLGAEEKAQWLERGHEDRPTAGRISTLQSGADNMEQDDIDDLVDALECRATCKDYSALLAFEKQAELETRQRHC